jgi:CDP-glycerol glycerophosphotransferase (TagB/SpsB family)/glycosyltransferase involved in cell wall biosynthesis
MKSPLNRMVKKYNLDKKLNKLKKDPNLFLTDMVNNKKNQLVNYLPISIKGANSFTIVTAVYNAEKYLDDFFKSIVNQSLSFKYNLQIICVDDGSIDNSAHIIQKWIKKYPENIQYFYKENGGQASARNLGLKHVKTKWVTFTDPDDFLNKNFFLNLENKILNIKNVKVLVSNMIFYFEKDKQYKNTHPLKYRFDSKEPSFNIKDLKGNIILSAATTIFDMQTILENNLEFDAKVKPVFEDGKFVADYFLSAGSGEVCFVKESQYFYRKREDQTSTLDTSWANLGKFDNVLRYGHLAMLKQYHETYGSVPDFIQRTTLYDVAWYVKYLLNDDAKTSHLTKEQKDNFLKLLHEIFLYINSSTIHAFNLASIWFKQKVGILGLLKNESIKNQIIYVENFDKEKKQIKISFFAHFDSNVVVKLNGLEVLPTYYKKVKNTFVGQKFVDEYVIWLPYSKLPDKLEVFVNGQISRISVDGKHYKIIAIKDIFTAMQNYKNYSNDGSWIFMDRDTQADDNAEHLYRYIKDNNLKEDCFFALRKESQDWRRLECEGFKLLEYGSLEFEKRLKSCNKVISSHLDKYVNNYFGDEYGYTKKFVFLQHGITKDDLSSWFNSKKNLFCLVTATSDEYNSIVHSEDYKFTSKDVLLSGFPRHDALFENALSEKIILIMPTWRNNLVGNTIGLGDARPYNTEFENSIYTQKWKSILTDSRLKKMVDEYNYKIIFAPHANITPYIHCFEIPEYIEIWSKTDSSLSIQSLFKKSKFMLTDYSSVAFEMGYLGKQTIYYQFDADEVFSGAHTYKKGYFKYEKHGFGPVVYEHEGVLSEISKLIQNDGVIFDEYLERIENTFTVRDQNNCKRVYEHLLFMGEYSEDVLELPVLIQFIEKAIEYYDLASLKVRLNYLFDHFDEAEIKQKYSETYHYLNSLDLGSEDQNKGSTFNLSHQNNVVSLCDALFNQDLEQYEIEKSSVVVHTQNADVIHLIELANNEKVEDFITNFETKSAENDNFFRLKVEQCNLDLLYLQALLKLDDYEGYEEYKKSQILTYRNSDFCLKLVVLDFEKAFKLEKWQQVTSIYQESFEGNKYLSNVKKMECYLTALLNLKVVGDLDNLIDDAVILYPNSEKLKSLKLKFLEQNKEYQKALELYEQGLILLNDDNKYSIIKSYYALGAFSKAKKILIKPVLRDDFSYWMLAWEIALQEGDLALDTYCRKHFWAYFPEQLQEHLPRINLMLEMLTSDHKRGSAS